MAALQEGQLGQLRPGDTTAASLYSPTASTTWRAKSLWICNTTGSAADARVFHDENGTTYDETTALIYDLSIAANTTTVLTGFMAGSDSTGNVGVRTGTSSALTFTLYGDEIT